MKIGQLPSDSYRIRQMYKGVTYSVVTEYKTTKKEATQLMAAEMDKVQTAKVQMTFGEAANNYIDLKKNVLSPSTIREYTNTINRLSESFVQMRISDVTALDVQKEINALSRLRTPKTVRNYHGFISAILGTFCPNLILNTTLPQKRKNEPYIPSDEDIRRILKEVEGTSFEIPVQLACFGLRRSEICALDIGDLKGDVLTVSKAKVLDKDKNWVIKSTKTTESTREVVIPPKLAAKIQEQGFIFKGHPNSITDHLNTIQDRLHIPHFSIHKLRHYFASKMSELGIPEADILKIGGWETDHVMKTVYRHSLQTKDSQRRATEKLNDALFS